MTHSDADEPSGAPPPREPFVLVIDDDDDLRVSLCDLLEDEGRRAVGCGSGREALALLRGPGPKPSLILLDLMMPGMNGWDLREQLAAEPALASIPVVVMTASRNPAGIQADAVLFKPVRLERLLEVIERLGPGASR